MASNKKTQNVFAHSPSLQILWRCAGQRRLVTKTLIHSIAFKNIYKEVLQYVNAKNRRRSPLSLILDSHLMVGLVYVYSKTVFQWHQDVEKLYKDAVVHRFYEFDAPVKSKMTRKKEAILTNAQWQIELDENLLPDERVLLERDFSIEIPRQPTPPILAQSPDNLPPLPWEVSKPTHGKRITLLPDIEEPMPKFDLIDDRFGELLPVPPITAMDVDQHEERTFFRPTSDSRSTELMRAPFVDRHLGANDRYLHPSHDRTVDENRPTRSVMSDLVPLPIAPMDTTTSIMPVSDRFTLDALAFFQSSLNTYPIYRSKSTRSILLGADCSSSADVPMIVIQEPTVIVTDEPQIPMDTMPPFDQQIPAQEQNPTSVDARVPEVIMASADQTEYFHLSKKKRNAPSAVNRKIKYPALYKNIIDFDYETLKNIDDEHKAELEELQREQKPWPTIVGRNGQRRMKTLIEKAKKNMATVDLRAMLDEIINITNMITNFDEPESIAQARRTAGEIAIRRGQSSGLLPKAGTRSSSIVPLIEERVSQLPIPALGGDALPTFPSGFDEIPMVPIQTESMIDIRQPLSPLQPARRDRTTTSMTVEPSPTWHDKQKQKAINDILNLVENSEGGSFNQFLKQSQATRLQAARLFSVLLALCGEERVKAQQTEPYAEINIFSNQKKNVTQHPTPDVRSISNVEPMDADDEDQF